MNTFAQPLAPTPRFRSLGAKFFLVLLLAFVMSISGFFVESLTTDRAYNHGVLAASSENPSASDQPRTVFGIRLADAYRAIRRSLHYITLFLGLVFLTYFLFEVLTAKSVHPAQYALVGIAQIIFYLLLLSLAEHIGFDLSYLIAGVATVSLFAANTHWVFRNRQRALQSLAAFSAVYAFIYVLLRVESYALLLGAVVSFLAVATAMFITRNVDWYAIGESSAHLATAPAASKPANKDSWLD